MAGRPPGHPKTGGRKKGGPNRLTKEVMAQLQELDFSPLDELVSLYRDPSTDIKDRIAIAKDLAQYVYPKRKAIDHQVGGGPDKIDTIRIQWVTPDGQIRDERPQGRRDGV